MRLLFVDHTGRPGGAELALKRYFEYPSNHERRLVVFQHGALVEWAKAAGIPSRALGWNGRGQSLTLLAALVRGWWLVFRCNSDVVVANSLNAAILMALLPKRKKVFVYYMREDLSAEWLGGMKRRIVIRYVLPRFDAFLANSRWTASTIPAELKEKPSYVVYTISGIVDTDGRRRQPNDETGKLRILSLSRLARWKGSHVLVQALAVLKQKGLGDRITATIAGGDLFDDERDYVVSLKRRALELEEMVAFVGHVEDVAGLLTSNDVMVSCSLNAEPFGQTIVQGMSYGLVVIATNQGGPAEIIQDGRTGILVPPDDPNALARAIESLITDPPGMCAIGDSAISAAQAYADAPMANLLESSIARIVKEFNGQA